MYMHLKIVHCFAEVNFVRLLFLRIYILARLLRVDRYFAKLACYTRGCGRFPTDLRLGSPIERSHDKDMP